MSRSSGPIFYAIRARDSPKTGRVVVAVESDDIQSPSYGQRLNIPNHEDVKDGDKGDTRPSEEPTGRAAVHRNRK